MDARLSFFSLFGLGDSHNHLFILFITSQRGSAWQCYIGRWRSKGKPAFFYCRPAKTNDNFKTNFGTGDYVGETYKHAKFG